MTVSCKILKFLESMFRKRQSYTRHPWYSRDPRYIRGPRHHHDPTCETRKQQSSPNVGIHLANSNCHHLPHRALTTCSRYGHASRYSDVLGQAIRSNRTKTQQQWEVLMRRIARNQAPAACATRVHGTCINNRNAPIKECCSRSGIVKYLLLIVHYLLQYTPIYESIFANRFLFIY